MKLLSTLIAVTFASSQMMLADSTPAPDMDISWDEDSLTTIYDPLGQSYSYAPSAVAEADELLIWSCHNRSLGEIHDDVFLTRIDDGNADSSTSSLTASPSGWDSFHICDPSVIRGRFAYDGTTYRYALFYLGNDVNASANNQVGVAFSNDWDGPWLRYPEPIVEYQNAGSWGVGQPSAISLDRKGQVALFYTNGDLDGTYGALRTLDLHDMSSPIIGDQIKLPTDGLTNASGGPDILNNFDIAFEPDHNRFIAVRDQRPNPQDDPNFIVGSVQIVSIPVDDLMSGTGTWTPIGSIDSSITGYPRNHNAGLVRDPFGTLPLKDGLTVVFATSCAGDGCNGQLPLWSYHLHAITGKFP